jgi:protein-tyrosine phosphatase
MKELFPGIFVAGESKCMKGNKKMAVVHACKSPCHQTAVNYSGNLPNTHKHYLSKTDEFNLYLNIIDPPVPLFKPELFTAFMDFASRHYNEGRPVLIHCNQGESRAPSLALLFADKVLQAARSESYAEAKAAFEKIYPRYNPGKGIQKYLADNWGTL